MRPRDGFTVIELVIVVVLMGIVTAMSIPRVTAIRSSAAMRAARQELATTLARTRALAVQQGRTVRFVRVGSVLTIVSASGGGDVTLVRARDLHDEHMVSLSGAEDIGFDARGFAGGVAGMAVIHLVRGELRDSVCVVRTGKILSSGCAP